MHTPELFKAWNNGGKKKNIIQTYQVRGHVLLSCGNHCKSRAFVLLHLQNVPCSRADVLRSFFCMLPFLQVCLHRALSPSLIPPAPAFFLPVSHGRSSVTHSPVSNHRHVLIRSNITRDKRLPGGEPSHSENSGLVWTRSTAAQQFSTRQRALMFKKNKINK